MGYALLCSSWFVPIKKKNPPLAQSISPSQPGSFLEVGPHHCQEELLFSLPKVHSAAFLTCFIRLLCSPASLWLFFPQDHLCCFSLKQNYVQNKLGTGLKGPPLRRLQQLPSWLSLSPLLQPIRSRGEVARGVFQRYFLEVCSTPQWH